MYHTHAVFWSTFHQLSRDAAILPVCVETYSKIEPNITHLKILLQCIRKLDQPLYSIYKTAHSNLVLDPRNELLASP